MSKFSFFNSVNTQPQLDLSVAPVWLAPQSGGLPISTSVATATIIADVPNIVSSSLVPESCLKEVITCELSPLGFHLNSTVKEKIWKGDYISKF